MFLIFISLSAAVIDQQILSDPPCKGVSARFTTVPLNLYLIKYELDIKVYKQIIFNFDFSTM